MVFDNELYITVTGVSHYYGMKPFDIGSPIILRKEPGNVHDSEAIMVLMPILGKVGYVANSPYTLARGCLSAGRIYDRVPDECAAVVRFITQTKIIARVFPDMRLNVTIDITIEKHHTAEPKKTSINTFPPFGGLQ